MSIDGFRPNPDGMEKLMAEISAKLQKVDADLRAEHTGRPAAEIEPHARDAFAAAGVNLTPQAIADYSQAVERGEDFTP